MHAHKSGFPVAAMPTAGIFRHGVQRVEADLITVFNDKLLDAEGNRTVDDIIRALLGSNAGMRRTSLPAIADKRPVATFSLVKTSASSSAKSSRGTKNANTTARKPDRLIARKFAHDFAWSSQVVA